MKQFKKLCDRFESYIDFLIVVVAVVMMIIGILQILFRYVFSSSLSWSEESIRYLHVWLVTVGGTICFYRGTFSTITLISNRIEARSRLLGKFLTVCRYVFPIIFYGYNTKAETVTTPTGVDYIAPTLSKAMRIRAPNACFATPLP